MDYAAHYRFDVDDLGEYYEGIARAQGRDPQATARTRDANGTIPESARELLYNISSEIKNNFHEFGAPMPPLLEGCTVVDLCCGSGRDTYLAAQLVGESGKVIGVEPVARRLAIAEKYHAQEIKQFKYAQSNVELVNAAPEDLSFIADGSVDVVVSNCTFNLSPDKERYIKEVKRILKDGGEWYFTDVFSDRRIPDALADDMKARATRLAGCMFVEDFRRLAQAAGFHDPRYVMTWKTPLSSRERKTFGDVLFATITCRLINSELTSDHCENYSEKITYDGTLPDYPDYFLYDKDIKLATGEQRATCDNVSVLGLATRYAKVLAVEGTRDVHHGTIYQDRIICCAPDFDGVIDEDDRPVMVSCC